MGDLLCWEPYTHSQAFVWGELTLTSGFTWGGLTLTNSLLWCGPHSNSDGSLNPKAKHTQIFKTLGHGMHLYIKCMLADDSKNYIRYLWVPTNMNIQKAAIVK